MICFISVSWIIILRSYLEIIIFSRSDYASFKKKMQSKLKFPLINLMASRGTASFQPPTFIG